MRLERWLQEVLETPGMTAIQERDEAWSALVAKHSRLLLTVARTVAAEHDGAMEAYAYVLERLDLIARRRLRRDRLHDAAQRFGSRIDAQGSRPVEPILPDNEAEPVASDELAARRAARKIG